MAIFRRKSEQELAAMDEDELVGYLVKARVAGDKEATGPAVAMLIWGFMETVRRRVSLKVPPEAIEQVSQSVLLSALASLREGAGFDGTSVGELRKWIGQIIRRRIADYHRNPKHDVRLEPLPTEHQGDEDVRGDEPSVGFEGEAIDAERALTQALEDLSPTHREVVVLYIFDDLPAAGVGERTGASEANVHQIAKRFRDHFRELFEGDT